MSDSAITPLVLETGFLSPNGFRCAATVYYPQQQTEYAYPAILMLHGWGGTQALLIHPFIEAFLKIGYAVMSFDYSTWGQSEGLPRNQISPWLRVVEAEYAIQHLKSLDRIDRQRIVLWGTSFGGGHAIDIAAKHTDLLGAIAHVPMLDGLKSVFSLPWKDTVKMGLLALADSLPKKKRNYVPIVAPKKQFSTMNRDDAYDFFKQSLQQRQIAFSSYANQVTARSVFSIGLYRPIHQLKYIQIPTLLIGAVHDTVTPFNVAQITKYKNPQVQYQLLNANHFQPYFQPVLAKNIQYQLDFLLHLKQQA